MVDELLASWPFFVVLILSLSFHEAAHAWAANKLGDPTARLLGRLTLNPLAHIDWIGTVLFPMVAILTGFPLIGWAKPVPVSYSNLRAPRRDFALIALAGPVSNVVLAAAGFVLLWALWSTSVALAQALAGFVALNLMLAAFNMLPVPPLDGGNVLAGVLPEAAGRVFDRLRPFGIVFVYLLLFYTPVFTYIYVSRYDVIGWLL